MPAPRPGGFLVVHPRYRAWLARCGIASAADALALPGEVVSGHPDRHVVRVELGTARRVVYLKREHVVGWRARFKNALAGFGRVSRAEREVVCLQRLERLGLPRPQWLAYGEDGTGRAFLLVDGLTGHTELRELLAGDQLLHADRRDLVIRLARAVADLHDAGFDFPDLSAKHVFVQSESLLPTLIDWQSARPRQLLNLRRRVRALATLTATVAAGLATPRERLRLLWAYHRSVRWPDGRPRFAELARRVQAEAAAIANRSSIREQRMATGPDQRLVWLAGEEVCARPELVNSWPTPAAAPPFYPAANTGPVVVTLPGREPATLFRFRSLARPGWFDRFLGRPWRSPAAKLARVFFHLERAGIPVPRLLAFGQRRAGSTRSESFVLHSAAHQDAALADFLTVAEPVLSRRVLFASGAIVRAIHDAGCRLDRRADGAALIRVSTAGDITIDPTAGLRKVRSVTSSARDKDLLRLLSAVPISRIDRLRLLAGYFAGDGRSRLRCAARKLLGARPAR